MPGLSFGPTAKSVYQADHVWAILVIYRREFQPQSTGLNTSYDSFGPDLSFPIKKLKMDLCTDRAWTACLDEQAF